MCTGFLFVCSFPFIVIKVKFISALNNFSNYRMFFVSLKVSAKQKPMTDITRIKSNGFKHTMGEKSCNHKEDSKKRRKELQNTHTKQVTK